ncbi:unnamed protein product [Phytophthora fragariaefolia]|uniref:Unnamed protein product n=1 Tax=Phytophthora fragariaefolia TaxID=1490495 RepID=A0A9W6X3S4_9STRA|nr:unnamed protein product [Phytophthora fragariaefolia]
MSASVFVSPAAAAGADLGAAFRNSKLVNQPPELGALSTDLALASGCGSTTASSSTCLDFDTLSSTGP